MEAVMIEEASLTETNEHLGSIRNQGNGGFRPWQEVNQDVSSRMLAASSDSPPIIPKKDYNESPRVTPDSTSLSFPERQNPAEYSDNIAGYRESLYGGQMVLYQGPPESQYGQFMPPPMMQPYPEMCGPPQFGSPFGMPPPVFYEDPVYGGFGQPFPMGPPQMVGPPPEFFDDDRLYRKQKKANKKKMKKWRSLEMMGPPPFGGPMPPQFQGCPPMGPPFGMDPMFSAQLPSQGGDAVNNSMALVPVGSMGLPPGQMMMPMYEPMPPPMPQMMPHLPPMPMSGFMTPPMTKTINNGLHAQNGSLPRKPGAETPSPTTKKPVKKHGTCYLICCRGHTQVLWIIIGIILVGVILGLVLGLTLVG